MNILEKIQEMAKAHMNEYLQKAISDKRKVVGYFCSYVPEELIHTAGMVPYRMRAVDSGGTEKGDAYFSTLNCTFVRHCFNKVMNSDFDFLSGIVFMNGCDHTRRLYDNWRHADVPPDFRYMFVTPHVINDIALKRMADEINAFKTSLEEHFSVSISDEKLKESISLYNKKRELLAAIYETRKEAPLPIRASELLDLLLVVTMVPVEDAISILEEVRDFIAGRAASRPGDIRIFLASGCLEESSHLRLMEESGAAIAADNMCLGSRHFHMPVDETTEPVHALAERYLRHLSCPRMMNDFKRRLDYMHSTIAEYSVDAVIIEKLKFCDLWGGEIFLYRQEAKKHDIPLLSLERELYGGGEGQIKTRMQAFCEKVKNNFKTEEAMFRAAGAGYNVKV